MEQWSVWYILSFSTKVCPFNPFPDMPVLGSSNSIANRDMISKIMTNGDTVI